MATANLPTAVPFASDNAALRAACEDGVGLCTIVNIEGSFSRRLGAQLAVRPDGSVIGSLADGCLERQLASEIAAARESGSGPIAKRFGSGSELIDFRLPCGSGIDVLIDPSPDHAACRDAIAALDARQPAALDLPVPADQPGLLAKRAYVPGLRLQLFGEGPEVEAMAAIARSATVEVEEFRRDTPASKLALGRVPENIYADPWTAIVLLFHDHEWETAILEWALPSPAFHVGAQGGREARENRREALLGKGIDAATVDRLHSPLGIVRHSREPVALALSALAQIVGEYEALHPHG